METGKRKKGREGNAVDVLLAVMKARGVPVDEESFRRARALCNARLTAPGAYIVIPIVGKKVKSKRGGEMR